MVVVGGAGEGAGIAAHPMFVVAVEWPTLWLKAARLLLGRDGATGAAPTELRGGVHYSQVSSQLN